MTIHTEKPPTELLGYWLMASPSTVESYGHILLEQATPNNDTIRKGLTPYFESAHADARQFFHKFARITIHPDEGEEGCNALYPSCLPLKARHGLFGEVMAGMATEAFPFVGAHEWVIPVFLFRKHEDVQQYIYTLSRDPSSTREVLGRKGDDFIGISVGEHGQVTHFIAGEAKWRQTWNRSTLDNVMLGDKIDDPTDSTKKIHNGKGVWSNINRALAVPIGLAQLQQILIELAPDIYADVILSLDRILALKNPDSVERTDLILLAGGSPARREKGETLLEWENTPPEYAAGRTLQVVEMILDHGDGLIKALYDNLWSAEVKDAAE